MHVVLLNLLSLGNRFPEAHHDKEYDNLQSETRALGSGRGFHTWRKSLTSKISMAVDNIHLAMGAHRHGFFAIRE